MDRDRGLLLAWLSLVYVRRNAKNPRDLEPDLPDLPRLGRLLSESSVYDWDEECHYEVCKLGRAAGFPFAQFLAELRLPINAYGYCSACPITVDATSEEISTSAAPSESLVPCAGDRSPVLQEVTSDVGLESGEAQKDNFGAAPGAGDEEQERAVSQFLVNCGIPELQGLKSGEAQKDIFGEASTGSKGVVLASAPDAGDEEQQRAVSQFLCNCGISELQG